MSLKQRSVPTRRRGKGDEVDNPQERNWDERSLGTVAMAVDVGRQWDNEQETKCSSRSVVRKVEWRGRWR